MNHSETFVAPDGTHTNTIEATWRMIKRKYPQKSDNIDSNEALMEYCWRRKNWTTMWDALEILGMG